MIDLIVEIEISGLNCVVGKIIGNDYNDARFRRPNINSLKKPYFMRFARFKKPFWGQRWGQRGQSAYALLMISGMPSS